ncbi:MAG: LysR family transcriptional regulator [Actinomycetota bacterium]
MNLKRLECFVAVAEELHFHRAAERLHMAQPPLSRQVKILEEELGITLFNRSTRTVTLTEAGRFLYPGVRKLLLDAAAIERRVTEFRSGEGGILRLGFVDSSSYETMPRFLRAHRARWPKVEYELLSMSSDEQREALADGQIDLGIGRATGAGPAVDATTLQVERLLLAVGVDHRLADRTSAGIGETGGEPFIGFDRRISPSMHTQLSNIFAVRDIVYDPIIEATEYTTILGLVASGQGIAIVPAGVRSFRPANLRYLDIDESDATSTLLLFSRTGDRSPLVERATELAAELFRP